MLLHEPEGADQLLTRSAAKLARRAQQQHPHRRHRHAEVGRDHLVGGARGGARARVALAAGQARDAAGGRSPDGLPRAMTNRRPPASKWSTSVQRPLKRPRHTVWACEAARRSRSAAPRCWATRDQMAAAVRDSWSCAAAAPAARSPPARARPADRRLRRCPSTRARRRRGPPPGPCRGSYPRWRRGRARRARGGTRPPAPRDAPATRRRRPPSSPPASPPAPGTNRQPTSRARGPAPAARRHDPLQPLGVVAAGAVRRLDQRGEVGAADVTGVGLRHRKGVISCTGSDQLAIDAPAIRTHAGRATSACGPAPRRRFITCAR